MTMRASALKVSKRSKERPVDIRALREKTALSQEQLARILGTSWISVSRWERRISQPSPETEARLKRLSELVGRIGVALPEAEVSTFLQTAQPLLRGYRPIDLLGNDYSFEDLLAFVDAAKSGNMA
jgi:transcriptional regulator with XRE-family HTH domain